MASEVLLQWNVVEAPPVKKSTDWFWAVGIILISLAVVAISFGNQLFGIFLLVILFTLYVLSHKRSQTVHYAITKDGIYEGNVFYSFSNIKNFFVDENTYTGPTLLIEVKRWFLPILSLPIPSEIAPQDVRMYLRASLHEHEIKEPVFQHLFEILGL